MSYAITFDKGWDEFYSKLDKSMRNRTMKKILRLEEELPARHLRHGPNLYVSEIGQYRLCYTIDQKNKTKKLFFVGDHKEYENWLGL